MARSKGLEPGTKVLLTLAVIGALGLVAILVVVPPWQSAHVQEDPEVEELRIEPDQDGEETGTDDR